MGAQVSYATIVLVRMSGFFSEVNSAISEMGTMVKGAKLTSSSVTTQVNLVLLVAGCVGAAVAFNQVSAPGVMGNPILEMATALSKAVTVMSVSV
jgi:hypothetical protein